jgi:hypothetical protein
MLTEAMQGIGIFAVVGIPGALAVWKLMASDAVPLPHGYVDETGATRRWVETMRPTKAPKLRMGTR